MSHPKTSSVFELSEPLLCGCPLGGRPAGDPFQQPSGWAGLRKEVIHWQFGILLPTDKTIICACPAIVWINRNPSSGSGMRMSISTTGHPLQRSNASEASRAVTNSWPACSRICLRFQLAGVVFHHQNLSHQANSLRAITNCGIWFFQAPGISSQGSRNVRISPGFRPPATIGTRSAELLRRRNYRRRNIHRRAGCAASGIGNLAFNFGNRLPDVALGDLHADVSELQVPNISLGFRR